MRRGVAAIALVSAVAVLMGGSGPASALFVATVSTGENTFTAAVLEPPTAVGADSDCVLLDLHVTVSWTPSPSTRVAGYNVFRTTTPGGSYEEVGSVLGALSDSFVDTTVALGTTYHYVVRAYYAEWVSVPTDEMTVTTVELC